MDAQRMRRKVEINKNERKLNKKECKKREFISLEWKTETFLITMDVQIYLQFINWKADEMAQSAEDFLLYHKFGHVSIMNV